MENIIARIFTIASTVIILVVAGALGFHAIQSSKLNSAQSEASSIISNVEQMYSATLQYGSLTTTTAMSGGIFTPDEIASGAPQDPWGGAITLAGANGTPSTFTLTFAGIAQDACGQLAAAFNGANILSVAVNGSTVGSPASGSPVDPGVASSSCGAGNTNSVTWTVK